MKKKMRWATALACALLILSVTALAVTLVQRSEPSSVTVTANQALKDKYGLTDGTIGLFVKQATQTGDEWTVDYIPDGYAPALLGQYRVLVKDGKATDATWSYDDTDVDWQNSEGLASPVWGQKQMAYALTHPDEASAVSAPRYEQASALPTPPPDRQDGDAWWMGELVYPAEPTADDLTKEQAVAIARQALMEEYGLTAADLDGAVQRGEDADDETLFYTRESGNPVWTLGFWLVKDGVEMDIGVVVDARTGEILLTNLMTGGNG